MTRKKISFTLIIIVIVAVAAYAFFKPDKVKQDKPSPTQSTQQQSTKQPKDNPSPAFDKNRYSIDDPNSLWVIANKKRPLPDTFVPSNLTSAGNSQQMQATAVTALGQLTKAAANEQITLRPLSGYRSFSAQKSVYNSYVASDGQTKADTYSARPGHSEHQTGLAIDVGNGQCDLEICFGDTAAGKWVAANAHTYGFIIRYQQDKTGITGYQYEPWHLRYVGVDLANELHSKNQTMEEFFGVPAAPGY